MADEINVSFWKCINPETLVGSSSQSDSRLLQSLWRWCEFFWIYSADEFDSSSEHAHLRHHFSRAARQRQGTMTSLLRPSQRNACRHSHWQTHHTHCYGNRQECEHASGLKGHTARHTHTCKHRETSEKQSDRGTPLKTMLTHDQTAPEPLCEWACSHMFPFKRPLQRSTGDLMTVIVNGQLANTFSWWTWERGNNWTEPDPGGTREREMWFHSRVLPKPRWNTSYQTAHCTSWLLWKQRESACVPEVERTRQRTGTNTTHAYAASCACACPQMQNHTSVTYLCVKLGIQKSWERANGAAAVHTHTHTHTHRAAFYRLGSHSNSSR